MFISAKSIFLLCAVLVAPQLALGDSPDDQNPAPLLNQLSNDPSPYLALHGSDPVAWQAWSKEAIARAERENKPLFISSGYFSCHWCHVMQAESYKDAEVAQLLNAYFIPIKIDRELESALDGRLMRYAQATLRRGGWPLNVFMSPGGSPLYAVLYQPQPQFKNILLKLVEAWSTQSQRIRELAAKERTLASFPAAQPKLDAPTVANMVDAATGHIMRRADLIQGGFGESNKFPSTPQLLFLVEQHGQYKTDKVDQFLRLTLDAMAHHGMMDQLSGGFYRYSVDPAWEIPHFEKMLYDNANLARLYLRAGAVMQEPAYTAIARRTLDFMIDAMAGADGALVAAFSAVDNDGVEGGHYLWTQAQLKSLLSAQELETFNAAWNMSRANDLEAGSHLRSMAPIAQIAADLKLSAEQARNQLVSAQQKLLKARAKRQLPVDDKFLAGWNGLALSAFSQAAISLDDERYNRQAEKIKTFLLTQLWDGEALTRGIARGQKVGSAAIEDYAYVAQGLLGYARLSGDQAVYAVAEKIAQQGWDRFYLNNAWGAADGSLLPPEDGQEVLTEGASASPAAVLIAVSLELYALDAEAKSRITLRDQALSALNRGYKQVSQAPFWYTTRVGAMQYAVTDLP